jgi:hypothetical protein
VKNQTILFTLLIVILLINYNQVCFAASDQVAIGGELVWEKTFGGIGDDRAFYAIAIEHGFLVVGSTKSVIENTAVAFIVCLDGDGNQLWNKTYPYAAGSEFRYIINLSDGFLLVGNEFTSNSDPNGFVIKIDNEGNMLWNITLGGERVDRLFSAAKGQDGFLLAGLTENTGNSNVWLTKINDNGEIMWNKTFDWSMDDAARATISTTDNAFLVVGYTDSTGNGDYNFLVLKVDNVGNLLWNQTYGGAESDKAYSITKANNGFVVAGDTRSEGAGDSDALIIKIDSQGNLEWEHTFGGSDFDAPTYINALDNGAGYLVGGTTFSYGNGQRDFWLFTIDNSGNLMQSCTIGRSNYEESYAAIQVSDDNFVMAGWTNSIGQGYYDFYVIEVQLENNIQWWQTNTFIATILIIAFSLACLFFLRWMSNRKKRLKKLNES